LYVLHVHVCVCVYSSVKTITHAFIVYFKLSSQAPVAHACNPRYSGGRDQEDRRSKQAQANNLWEPISTKLITQKKGCWSGLRWRPWLLAPVPHTHKNIKWQYMSILFLMSRWQLVIKYNYSVLQSSISWPHGKQQLKAV
jgi:hypothetical protein